MKRLHVYEIDDGETFWYVAFSSQGAFKAYLHDHSGQTPTEYRREVTKAERAKVTQCPDRRKLSISFENERGDYDEKVTKTCGAWAKQSGDGVLCQTLI